MPGLGVPVGFLTDRDFSRVSLRRNVFHCGRSLEEGAGLGRGLSPASDPHDRGACSTSKTRECSQPVLLADPPFHARLGSQFPWGKAVGDSILTY